MTGGVLYSVPMRVPKTRDAALAPTIAASEPSHADTQAADLGAAGNDAAAVLDTTGAAAASAPLGLLASQRATVIPRARREGGQVCLESQQSPRYRAQRVLGRGGMGEVLLAQDDDIGRPVAVKRVLSDTPELLARFADEIRIMGQLEHPNIAGVYDVDLDADGHLFFTMRYIAGEPLSDIIERLSEGDAATRAKYPLARRLDIFIDVMSALAHAHEVGVLHRDVKPDNIMIGANGDVVLADWGIARGHQVEGADGAAKGEMGDRIASTSAGGIVGTPLYMSPEQAAGAPVDARADLYSAFAVLFELLTLQTFVAPAPNLTAVLAAAQTREPPGVYSPIYAGMTGHPPVPAELRHYLIRGLNNDKNARFRTATEALDTLAALRSGHIPISCPATLVKSTQGRTMRLMEKWPRATLAVIGAVLLIVAVCGVRALFDAA